MNITVTTVNDAPVAVNDTNTTNEDTPTSGNLLTNDTDIDTPTSGLTAALGTQATKGTAAVNADGAYTYTPGANVNGTDTFTYTVSDGTRTDTGTVTITVAAVNDAPVSTTAGVTSYTEEAPAVVVDCGLTVADADSTMLTGATVAITGGFQPGDTLSVDIPNGSAITSSYNTTTGALTLTGTASAADYQAVLRSVKFASTTATPAPTKTVSFVVRDDLAKPSAPAMKSMGVAINQAPAVATTSGAGGYVAQGSAVVVDAGLTVSDSDSATMTGATVTLGDSFQTGDTLNVTIGVGSTITGTYNGATGVLTLTGEADTTDYQTVLRSITFATTNPTPTTKTITYTITDHTALTSPPATRTIAVIELGQPPAVSTTPVALTYAVGDPPITVDPAVTVSDPDSTVLNGATIRIIDAQFGDELVYTPAPGATIARTGGTAGNGDTIITMAGNASLADYQQALRNITFSTTTTTPRTITIGYTITDELGNASPEATRTITVITAL